MLEITLPSRLLHRTLPALVVAALVGCAHVKPDQLDSRLADLRADLESQIQEGDEEVAGQMEGLQEEVDGLEGQIAALQQELETLAGRYDATVERLQESLRFNVPVHFGFDEAELSDPQREILNRFAQVVRQHYPDYLITVEGFTDPVGTEEYNRSLGLRRARAVKTYLTDMTGLVSDRIRTVTYGEADNRLVAPDRHGPGPEGRDNRRVALVVDHAGG